MKTYYFLLKNENEKGRKKVKPKIHYDPLLAIVKPSSQLKKPRLLSLSRFAPLF